jgi:hypothetical protein
MTKRTFTMVDNVQDAHEDLIGAIGGHDFVSTLTRRVSFITKTSRRNLQLHSRPFQDSSLAP